MKRIVFCLTVLIWVQTVTAQTVSTKLTAAWKTFTADAQMKHAIASLYVIDAKTGKVVFESNSTTGLAPASTQKVITAITAYELLGKDFRYKTEFGYARPYKTRVTATDFYIRMSGDPTLGSWRWKETSENAVLGRIVNAFKKNNIADFESCIIRTEEWTGESIPDGWIWQDVGNYYGAGSGGLNWRENQFDLTLRSGKEIGDDVSVVDVRPRLYRYTINSLVRSAARGTDDRSYIYLPIGDSVGVVRGTIPVNEQKFVISGSMPSPETQFAYTLMDSLERAGIERSPAARVVRAVKEYPLPDNYKVLHVETSPPLDSIVYWFLKKSINLYGEALMKTFAAVQKKEATTANGLEELHDFWKPFGLSDAELNMVDGSGLSPANRVTTRSLVKVLQYARTRDWFPGFYQALPEYNGMKMKSGTIGNVKAFCGYHKSKAGQEYIFAIIVNNYNGSSSAIVQKIYKVLDGLK